MGFWLFLLAMNLLIPCGMIGIGRYLQKHPPQKISSTVGYRTARSMKSQAAWDFAQRHWGKTVCRIGWILLPCDAAAMLAVLGTDIDTTGIYGSVLTFLQIIPLVCSCSLTESALKRNFHKDGTPKGEGPFL